MKNKTLFIGFLLVLLVGVSSCARSSYKSGYQGTHRKGYGCPASAY